MLKKVKVMLVGSVATQASLLSLFDRSTSSGAGQLPAEIPMQETSTSARLHDVFLQLKSYQAEFLPGLVNDLLESIPVLRTWQRGRHPADVQRDAMQKHACVIWKLRRRTTSNDCKRSSDDIAQELGGIVVASWH